MRITYLVALSALVVSLTALGQELQTPEGQCALSATAPSVLKKLDVPFGAQHRNEVVWRKTAPDGFGAVLALMQAVSVAPCDGQAKIAIRAIRLIEHDPGTGREAVVSEITDFSRPNGTTFAAKLFQRLPRWYPPNGSMANPVEGMVNQDDRALVVDLSKAPRSIYHGWTEPQAEARPGMNYLVEMEVKISGMARLQMGIDYWRAVGAPDIGWDGTCQKTNHCEGYLSKWYGPTDGFQTIRVPDAFRRL